jgi:sRNA-binding carbon storage regulator CsrA
MNNLITYLQGGDLRSIANVDRLLPLIKDQNDFDELFRHLYSDDRLIIMRTADAIEKITVNNPKLIAIHKSELIEFLDKAQDKEFKWHLVLLVSRLKLMHNELGHVWAILTEWAKDKSESKIVRVNSLQALHDLTLDNKELKKDFELTIQGIERENIPSLKARIRKFKTF